MKSNKSPEKAHTDSPPTEKHPLKTRRLTAEGWKRAYRKQRQTERPHKEREESDN